MSTVKEGVFWNVVKTLLERGLLFAQQIILAWFLLPDVFGVFSFLTSTLAISSLFAIFGLSEVLSNRFKKFNDWLPIANSSYYVIIFFSIVFFFSISLFHLNHNVNNFLLVLIYSFSIPLIALKQIDFLKLSIEGHYKFISITRVLYTLVLTTSSVVLAYFNFKIFSLVIASSLASLIEFIVIRNKTKINFRFSKNIARIKTLLLKSIDLAGYTLSWRIINFLDFILIGIIHGDKIAGLYFMAFSISVQAINLFVTYLPSIIFSSNIRDNLTLEATYSRIQRITLIITFFSSPIFFGIFFYSDSLINILFNSNWSEVSPLLKILSIAMIPRLISSQWYLGHLHQKKYKYMSRISIRYLFIFLILFIPGTYFFQVEGSVYAILIFYTSSLFIAKDFLFIKNPYLIDTFISVVIAFLSYYFLSSKITFENELYKVIIGSFISTSIYLLVSFIICFRLRSLILETMRLR